MRFSFLFIFIFYAHLSAMAAPKMAAPNMEYAKSVFESQDLHATPSVIPGIFQFSQGTEVFYISEDGRYVIQGEMVDLKTQANLTESFRATERLKVLAELPAQGKIKLGPHNPRFQITVFIDINCPYCRVIQERIHEYERLGIAVNYLAFPRSGLHSSEGKTLANIWCSEKPLENLFSSEVEKYASNAKACPIVQLHYAAGVLMGVTSTPAVLLEDGTLIPGFVSPDSLATMLAEHAAKKNNRKTALNK